MSKQVLYVLLDTVLTAIYWWLVACFFILLAVQVIFVSGLGFKILISLVICSPE